MLPAWMVVKLRNVETSAVKITYFFLVINVKAFNPFQSSDGFHIETSHLICIANQVTGFYMKCSPELKWFSPILSKYWTKNEVSIKDLSSKCHQIRSILRIWSHLLKKSLIDCAVMVRKETSFGCVCYLTLNILLSFFWCFYCWFWASKYWLGCRGWIVIKKSKPVQRICKNVKKSCEMGLKIRIWEK